MQMEYIGNDEAKNGGLFIRQCLDGENDRGDRMDIDIENLVMKEGG